MAYNKTPYQWGDAKYNGESKGCAWCHAWWYNIPDLTLTQGPRTRTKGFIVQLNGKDGYWITWGSAHAGPHHGPYPTLEVAKTVYLLEGGGIP